MFVGHFGLGFAGKKAAPSVSLGSLFLSVQLADALWPLFLLLRIEHVRVVPGITRLVPLDFYDYPWSHSLLMLAGWGLAFGAIHYAVRRNLPAVVLLAGGVVSHWVLDFLVHRPDMPVLLRGPYAGLGLWNSAPATVLLEVGLFGGGIALYLSATRAADRTGIWSLWTLVVSLFGIWIASLLGPPPPGTTAIALAGIAMWLTVPWGYWIDRHREPRSTGRRSDSSALTPSLSPGGRGKAG